MIDCFADMAQPYLYRFGWAVFPVSRSGRKKPLVKGGCHAATTNLDLVDEWSDRFGACNIAASTGFTNGICVLDVDAPEGLLNLQKLLGDLGVALPRAPCVRSGGGGLHYYFAQPPEKLKNRAGHIAPGLDIRSEGGSIVLPPSIHKSGRRYVWAVPLDEWCSDGVVTPPPMPEWLRLKAAADKLPARLRRGAKDFTTAPTKILELEETELRRAQPGGRNYALNRAAFVFGQFVAVEKISEQDTRSRLTAIALDIGLDPAEIGPTIDSGLRAGLSQPRQGT